MNRFPVSEGTTNDSSTRWNGALPTPLKLLLAEELRGGNSIQEITARGRKGEAALLVLLAIATGLSFARAC